MGRNRCERPVSYAQRRVAAQFIRVLCPLMAFFMPPAAALAQLGMSYAEIEAIYGTNGAGHSIGKDSQPLAPIKKARWYPCKDGGVEFTVGFSDGKVRYVQFLSRVYVKSDLISEHLGRCRPRVVARTNEPSNWSTDVAQTAVFPPLGQFVMHKGSLDGSFGPKMRRATEVIHSYRVYSNGYREYLGSSRAPNAYAAIPGSEAPGFMYTSGYGVERQVRVRADQQAYVTIEATFGTQRPYQIRRVLFADSETHWRVLFAGLLERRLHPANQWNSERPGDMQYDSVLSSRVAPDHIPSVYESCIVDLMIAAAEREQLMPDVLEELLAIVSAEEVATRACESLKGVSAEDRRRRVRLLGELPAEAAVPRLIRYLSTRSLQGDAVDALLRIASRDAAAAEAAASLGSAKAKWQAWWDTNRDRLP